MKLISYLAILIPLIFGIIAITKWKLEKHSFIEILNKLGIIPVRIKNFTVGIIIGAIAISIVFLFYIQYNLLTILSFEFKADILLESSLILILSATLEELISRSLFISGLSRYLKSSTIIIIITALLFSMAHLFNEGVTIISSVSTFIGGIMYAYAFIKTKNIWLPIGLHFSWNFFQGCIYGFPVSGRNFEGIYELSIVGNEVLTGGVYGPEGGLIGIIARILVIFLLWITTRYIITTNHR